VAADSRPVAAFFRSTAFNGSEGFIQAQADLAYARALVKVDSGAGKLAHEGSRVVLARETLARNGHKGGLGPVGHQFDGVHEMLSGCREPGEAVFLRQVL